MGLAIHPCPLRASFNVELGHEAAGPLIKGLVLRSGIVFSFADAISTRHVRIPEPRLPSRTRLDQRTARKPVSWAQDQETTVIQADLAPMERTYKRPGFCFRGLKCHMLASIIRRPSAALGHQNGRG